MRRFINWLKFLGKFAAGFADFAETTVPAYDELKKKNAALRLEEELKEQGQEAPVNENLKPL